MKLRFEKFSDPISLCGWVNTNPDPINIIGVCQDEFGKYVLFYSTSSNVENDEEIPRFDAEAMWANRYRKGGVINGSENSEER